MATDTKERCEAAVLVSPGRHPASGRARRADADARAVELALNSGAESVEVIHAGDPLSPALRDYLGMGLERLTVLELPPGADPLPALAAYLSGRRPGLVLAGVRAEAGEDSGLVPYMLAEALGYTLAPGIVAVSLTAGGASMVQAVPGGGRRALSAATPLVLTVDRSAPPARPFAFARARRGRIETLPTAAVAADPGPATWERRPARQRPKRLKTPAGGSAAERLRAATQLAGGGGKVLSGIGPDEAAREILDFLNREGLI